MFRSDATVDDPKVSAAMQTLFKKVEKIPHVSVSSPYALPMGARRR